MTGRVESVVDVLVRMPEDELEAMLVRARVDYRHKQEELLALEVAGRQIAEALGRKRSTVVGSGQA